MKLTNNDKNLLKEWGYKEEDLKQIEVATRKTIYKMKNEKISCKKALEELGRETFLSGISRSAFHWSCTRNTKSGKSISFDSSKLFE